MSTHVSDDKLLALRFRGKLSTNSENILSHLFQTGCRRRRFRLEFVRVTEVDLACCGALLRTLTSRQTEGCEVNLSNADALADKIRGLIQPGRRDADDTGWRLLMELLWMMQAAPAYEATCVDYSMTYEVSPPSPRSGIANPQDAKAERANQAFVMPAAIKMPIDALLMAIDTDAQGHERMVLDCAGLRRVDFNAAAPLLAGLNRLATIKPVELRHTSFLVSVLLQLVGGNSELKIIHRKT